MHAYNNFFYDVKLAGIECTDSASCYIEGNVFNNEKPVAVYRLQNKDGTPDKATLGFVYMIDNWFGRGGENISGNARGFKPDYKVSVNEADAALAVSIKNEAGPR